MGKKAVALVSGGKDSVYAIHCALQVGFSIRAVATLLPRDNAVETDSYMYQSVGTNLGSAIAECLDVPHYSAHVKGRPVNTETLQYTFDSNDEVYDLELLLKRVTEAHPDVEAVTCGAILSEYQRRRLEYICGSIRLLPVCLMWNREQKSLLKNMVDWGLQAVVVKTASMGLSKQHLGRSVSDLLPHFLELNRQYDFHVCGEGGEYETVTLDCPLFTKGSIAVSNWEQICHSDDTVAPVWLQSPLQWSVVPKDPATCRPQLRPHAMVHDLEWLRTKPYQDLIGRAVKVWGLGVHDGDPAAVPPLCGKGVDLGAAPNTTFSSTWRCKWTWRFPTFSLGCILTGDICVACNDKSGEAEGSNSPPLDGSLEPLVAERMSKWLDEQLRQTMNSQARAHIVEAACQVCCADFMRIPEKVFEQLGIRPVALTVVVAPLPREVQVRLRIVLSTPEGLAVDPAISLKSFTDDSVVHVHSVNLWVPSCADGGVDAVNRLGVCRSCQGVRCELLAKSSLSVVYLFLRGCDGRLPFTCDFPDESNRPLVLPSTWTCEEYRMQKPAFFTALQTVNAFVSMQYTRHLCYAGGANRGFPHDDCDCFIGEIDLGDVSSAKYRNIDSAALRDSHIKTPPFMAPCIVVFVKFIEGKGETKTKSDQKLGAVKQLMHSLIARSYPRSDSSFSGDDTATQCILIVAELPSLPREARVLMLPMWDISPRLGDRDCSQTCCTKHLRQQGERYTATVTEVERRLQGRADTDATGAGDGDTGIRSVVVCFSFEQRQSYTGHHTLDGLLGQLYSTLTQWLKEHTAPDDVALLSCGDTEKRATVRGRERMLEVCVFYCPSYLCSLHADSESFEAHCRQRIETGCCDSAAASSKLLPIITFFPVLNLACGLLEVVAHTLSACPK